VTRDEFWAVIAAARDGDFAGRPGRLRELLLMRPPKEVASFIQDFRDAMDDAYSYELWGAAYVIGGGCSDDSFMDFRKWLISCGRERYERALVDPESLVDVTFGPDAEEDAFFEEFSITIALDVFTTLTGEQPPPRMRPAPRSPHGQDWVDDDLPTRYPRLWKRWSKSTG
jgi:hypothetical protein